MTLPSQYFLCFVVVHRLKRPAFRLQGRKSSSSAYRKVEVGDLSRCGYHTAAAVDGRAAHPRFRVVWNRLVIGMDLDGWSRGLGASD